MSFTWPQFVTPQPLDGSRTWTASFDSYDQYREDCYYCVRLFDGAELVAELMAQVSMGFAGDDWRGPTFVDEVRAQVARVAAAGATNTSWAGHQKPLRPARPHQLPRGASVHEDPHDDHDERGRPLGPAPRDHLHVARGWRRPRRVAHDLVDRTNGCVVRTGAARSEDTAGRITTSGVRSVHWDGDVLVVINVGTKRARNPA
jgi:hypothetical protein